jgi:hypothetical protein
MSFEVEENSELDYPCDSCEYGICPGEIMVTCEDIQKYEAITQNKPYKYFDHWKMAWVLVTIGLGSFVVFLISIIISKV